MTRAEKREIKRKLKREIAEFLNIQNHYFPDLIEDIKKVLDGRHQSYIRYEIQVILLLFSALKGLILLGSNAIAVSNCFRV